MAVTEPSARAGGRMGMQHVGLCKHWGMGDARGRLIARVVMAMARSKVCKSRTPALTLMWV